MKLQSKERRERVKEKVKVRRRWDEKSRLELRLYNRHSDSHPARKKSYNPYECRLMFIITVEWAQALTPMCRCAQFLQKVCGYRP